MSRRAHRKHPLESNIITSLSAPVRYRAPPEPVCRACVYLYGTWGGRGGVGGRWRCAHPAPPHARTNRPKSAGTGSRSNRERSRHRPFRARARTALARLHRISKHRSASRMCLSCLSAPRVCSAPPVALRPLGRCCSPTNHHTRTRLAGAALLSPPAPPETRSMHHSRPRRMRMGPPQPPPPPPPGRRRRLTWRRRRRPAPP